MSSDTWCDFQGCSLQSQELDLIILFVPFQLGILCDSVMFKCLKIVLGCFTNSFCDHIKFRNLLRTVVSLMMENWWCSVKQISLRQFAVFTAFFFQIDLQKAESLGIKQAPGFCVQIVYWILWFITWCPKLLMCVKPGLPLFISVEKIARQMFVIKSHMELQYFSIIFTSPSAFR